MSGEWTVRVRDNTLHLLDPIQFTSLTLVENYGNPDMLAITGRLSELRPALVTNYGCVVYDETGTQRFSGIFGSDGIERHGDGTATLVYVADTVHMWWRVCYPVPANDWVSTGQTTAYDSQTGVEEARIIAYVNRNLGPSARTERKLTALRMPTSLGRGVSATSQVRFDQLGQLVADLAEAANLRVRIVQTYDLDNSPHLDLKIDDAPDLSAWARFGDVSSGGPGVLSQDWSYKIGRPLATTALCAAGGEGVDRELGKASDTAAESLWGARVEAFVDQRGVGDLPDAKAELAQAIKDRDAAYAKRALAARIMAVAFSNLTTANDNLAKHPGDSGAQAAKDAAQDAYDSAHDDYDGFNTEYNDAVTAVTAATTAQTAAAASDATAIAQAVADFLAENVGASDVTAPLGASEFDLGTEIPVGAKCAAELDGEPVLERIRQITTTVQRVEGSATVQVNAILGSPDAALLSPTQRKLANALKRLTNLERSA